MNELYLTVSAVTKYIKHKIEQDDQLKMVYLKGEISNFKSHTTGHYYFSLKDEFSKINAVMFNTNAQKLKFTPKEGMKVLITGRVGLYETTGNYQIYVNDMIEDGVGNLYIAFEQLKEKLSKEGLFSEEFKKSIPEYPQKIGVITAATGAAVKDIITTIKRRYPLCEIFVFPCLVQGENAGKDISNKIKQADLFELSTLIVGRGGGSIEDLWAFNEEIVARTIFEAKTPIISAVGHEIDFTIADFVADLRAPTPTAAAEIAVPNIIEIKKSIIDKNNLIKNLLFSKLNNYKNKLNYLSNHHILKNPMILIEKQFQRLDYLKEKINNIMTNYISITRINLNNIIDNLELLNPLKTINRGYSIIKKDNKVISDINNFKINDEIDLILKNGKITSKIINIKGEL